MKRLLIAIILILTGLIVYSQPDRKKLMPVTTDSKTALNIYKEAKKYYDDVFLDKALETFKKALIQDPGFFMANYQLAFYYLLNREADDFYKYGEAAISSKARLSNAEEILKQALTRLINGNSEVSDLGKKLVELYPDDPESYNNLASFQSLEDDNEGMIETLLKAVEIAPDPAPFYNQLGYAYLAAEQSDKAEKAFDRYMELAPKNPNVYDSKGDYYMYLKKYDKAYELYMKAYSLDPSFSREKADAAQKLFEKSEGRKIEIIPM
jgi:tetratricopeptide (TPR) repeat protein